jgi:diguanylate cyclase (GGDEF)-like protein
MRKILRFGYDVIATTLHGWDRFATNGGRFSPGHLEFRRAYLINTILVAMSALFLFFSFLNLVFFRQYEVAIVLTAGALLAALALLQFHLGGRIMLAAIVTVLIEIVVLAGVLVQLGHRQYALYWVTVIPLSSNFLLGRKLGRIVTAIVFAFLAAFVAFHYGEWASDGFSVESLANVALALCCLTLMVNYYEQSRSEADAAIEQKNLELERLSVTDKLTGIFNRNKLDDVLSYELSNAARYDRTFSLILGDIDHFKAVNDRFGHITGDAVLKDFGVLLRSSCRCIDTVGRWGGEEFLIICPETKIDGAWGLAERIRRIVADHPFPISKRVTISFGVAEYRRGDDAAALLKRADEALYAAKNRGRNCVEC